jgi:hypothetical protein
MDTNGHEFLWERGGSAVGCPRLHWAVADLCSRRGEGIGEGLGVGGIDQPHFDAEFGQDVFELGVAAAIEVAGGDDVVAGLGEVDDRVEDRRGAGGHGEPGGTAFEGRDALLEHVVGGVHQPGVDVPEFLEREQVGGVLGAVEDVGRGPVERDGPGVGGRVGGIAGVEAEGIEFHGISCWLLAVGD